MIPTVSLVFGGAPMTAGLPASGLEPVFWAMVVLLTFAAARVAHAAWTSARPNPPAAKGSSRLRVVEPLRA